MGTAGETDGRLLVVFDSHCGLCHRAVRWLLRRDSSRRLRFTPYSSKAATALLETHGIRRMDDGPGSVLIVQDFGLASERVLERSAAVMAALRVLPQPWPAVAALAALVPQPLRDAAYRLIARWRYRVWGRVESCQLPAPGEGSRFL
jgi:predicted DCC family thiol-disulfide oxidoreductase YuxK